VTCRCSGQSLQLASAVVWGAIPHERRVAPRQDQLRPTIGDCQGAPRLRHALHLSLESSTQWPGAGRSALAADGIRHRDGLAHRTRSSLTLRCILHFRFAAYPDSCTAANSILYYSLPLIRAGELCPRLIVPLGSLAIAHRDLDHHSGDTASLPAVYQYRQNCRLRRSHPQGRGNRAQARCPSRPLADALRLRRTASFDHAPWPPCPAYRYAAATASRESGPPWLT
jgi:hypothetical protein